MPATSPETKERLGTAVAEATGLLPFRVRYRGPNKAPVTWHRPDSAVRRTACKAFDMSQAEGVDPRMNPDASRVCGACVPDGIVRELLAAQIVTTIAREQGR